MRAPVAAWRVALLAFRCGSKSCVSDRGKREKGRNQERMRKVEELIECITFPDAAGAARIVSPIFSRAKPANLYVQPVR